MNIDRIDLAQIVATGAHANQVRPFTGEPYIGHPARVVGFLAQYCPTAGDAAICAAWLHDVVEDTSVTLAAIEQSFDRDVAALVWELTKPNRALSQRGMCIKACDLLDNVGMIADVAPRAQAQAYLAKKAPQVLRICEGLQNYYPALAERLAQTYWSNYTAAFA